MSEDDCGCGMGDQCQDDDLSRTVGDDFKLVEKARLDAVMRMLVDSGDMTPMAVRQIKLSLGIEPSTVTL